MHSFLCFIRCTITFVIFIQVIVDSSTQFPFSEKLSYETHFQIVVPNPDVRGRQDILDLYLADKPLADDVDIKAIARGTPGFNGAGMLLLKS